MSGIWAAFSARSAWSMHTLSTQTVTAPKRLRRLHSALWQLAVTARRQP